MGFSTLRPKTAIRITESTQVVMVTRELSQVSRMGWVFKSGEREGKKMHGFPGRVLP